MFSRITRIAALVTALMAVVGVAQASASTWTVSGGPNFTATAGAGSLSTSAGTLSCTGATATGAFSASTSTSVPWNNAASASVTFTGCRLAGQNTAVACTNRLNANSYDSVAMDTRGTLSSVSCTVTTAGVLVCNIVNSAPLTGDFSNTSQILTVDSTSNLTVTNGAAHCPLLAAGGTSDRGRLVGTGTGGSVPLRVTTTSGGTTITLTLT